MKHKIFLVEDDADIRQLIRHNLESAGFEARVFARSAGVIQEALADVPSLFLLDIMVPGMDGMELCAQIRENLSLAAVPVIFVTAKTDESDRVAGLELGADDYITKPFSPRELVARVRAVLRRFERPAAADTVKVRDMEVDSGAMRLTVRGRPVPATATEFRLLDFLVRHPGRVFTRDQLLDAVWRDTSFVTPRSVDVYVRRIREKIEPDPDNPTYIKTVRGAGYLFELPS